MGWAKSLAGRKAVRCTGSKRHWGRRMELAGGAWGATSLPAASRNLPMAGPLPPQVPAQGQGQVQVPWELSLGHPSSSLQLSMVLIASAMA